MQAAPAPFLTFTVAESRLARQFFEGEATMLNQQLRPRLCALGAAAIVGAAVASSACAADGPTFEIYGFAMADYIQDFNRVDPNWTATLRPSKIPTVDGEFGSDGQSIISARQSRFGATADQPIAGHDLFIKFEFDLFGTGVDEGQTTFRLRHFYGSWGPILAGQTNSVFMDIDTFPNVVDYWGPNGMVFLRNPQVRYTFKTGRHEIAVAIEKPSNDIDSGDLREIDPALGNIRGDQKIPDFTAHWRYDDDWGHVQLAGILREVAYDSPGNPDNRPKGSKLGWGVNASANINFRQKKDILHLSVVYGDGIASYMNDGGVDLAPGGQPIGPTPVGFAVPADATTGPPVAEAQQLLGLVAYLDHAWSDKFSSSLGWSMVRVDNSSLQSADAFHEAQYASANLLFSPDKHILMGAEFLWGQRQDKDRATGHDARVQFSFKYSFSSKDFFH
jgi:hypothetical protein